MERVRAFWAGASVDSRPAIQISVQNKGWQTPPEPLASLPMRQREADADWQEWMAGCWGSEHKPRAEAVSAIHPHLGKLLMILLVAAGGDYGYVENEAWPIEDHAFLDRELPPPTGDPAAIGWLDSAYEAVMRGAEGLDKLVTGPLMCDPLTTLSQLIGSEALVMEMLERSELVHAWIDRLTEIHNFVFHRYYRRAGAGPSLVFFGPLVEGPAEAIQCDFSVMISPDMFREFARPMLDRISSTFVHSLYHLDGVEQMRFLDEIAAVPNCRGIQWNPATDYGQPQAHIEHLREIRGRGLCLLLNVDGVEEAEYVVKELGPEGLFIRFGTPIAGADAAGAESFLRQEQPVSDDEAVEAILKRVAAAGRR